MKAVLFTLSLVLLSSFAHADISEKFQENCSTKDAKNLVGSTGSCRILIAVKKTETKGMCIGIFKNALACAVTYVANDKISGLKLQCGTDLAKPTIDQTMKAEIKEFDVATIIKKSDGQDVIQNDKNNYKLVSAPQLEVSIVEKTVNGTKEIIGSIEMKLEDGPVALTNVTCQ